MSVIVSYLDTIWIFQYSDCNVRLCPFSEPRQSEISDEAMHPGHMNLARIHELSA